MELDEAAVRNAKFALAIVAVAAVVVLAFYALQPPAQRAPANATNAAPTPATTPSATPLPDELRWIVAPTPRSWEGEKPIEATPEPFDFRFNADVLELSQRQGSVARVMPTNMEGDALTDYAVLQWIGNVQAFTTSGREMWSILGNPNYDETPGVKERIPAISWDFNGDGRDEIVTITSNATGRFLTMASAYDGSVVAAVPWPAMGLNVSAMRLATLDSDRPGKKAIIVLAGPLNVTTASAPELVKYNESNTYLTYSLTAYNETLGRMWNYSANASTYSLGRDFAIVNPEGDRTEEVFAGFALINNTGGVVWRRTDVNASVINAVAAADVNADGRKEIVIAAGTAGLLALDSATGATLWNRTEGNYDWVGVKAGDVEPDKPGDEVTAVSLDSSDPRQPRLHLIAGDSSEEWQVAGKLLGSTRVILCDLEGTRSPLIWFESRVYDRQGRASLQEVPGGIACYDTVDDAKEELLALGEDGTGNLILRTYRTFYSPYPVTALGRYDYAYKFAKNQE